MSEQRIEGKCPCGRKVTKILNSEHPTNRVDGTRYVYTDKPDDGWCLFRCQGCSRVVSDTWVPLTPPAAPDSQCKHCNGTGEVAWDAGETFSISPCGCPIGQAKAWLLKQPCDGKMLDHKNVYWVPFESVPKLLAEYAATTRGAKS